MRVPVFTGHSVSINAGFERPLTAARALELLRTAPGVVVTDTLGIDEKRAARRRPFRSDPAAWRAGARTGQRLAIGTTSRRVAPVKSCRGRPIFWSGSPIISFHCAIQPTVRASAKMQVNMSVGMPSAFCTMPE